MIPVEEFSIVDQRPLCPESVTCVVDGTILTVETTSNGCFDKLSPVRVVSQDDNTILVGADNIVDKRSLAAYCSAFPVARFEITLINKYGEFEIQPLLPIVTAQ